MAEHSFTIEDAEKYGVECAVLLKNIRFWLDKNLANQKHIKDGKVWTYNSVKAFSELFPYLSEKQIYRRLEKLEEQGIVISGNFNELNYDKTKWYTVNEGKYNLCSADGQTLSRNREIELPKSGNGIPEIGKPIPDSKPYSKPDTLYSENEFLEDWATCRKTYRNLPTNFKRLESIERTHFDRARRDFSREEFQQAMMGLFKQEQINFSSMITRPKHFLERVEQYLTAFQSKDFKQYGSKPIEH